MSPYEGLPPRSYWKTGVANQHPLLVEDLYRKKFAIARDAKIATAGSCFAQHIARHMMRRGYNVIDKEPAPPGLDHETAVKFGYQIYSARYGNIYLARQLNQLVREATGKFAPQGAIWEKNGRYYDALRPSVEPNGLRSPEEVSRHRQAHLSAVLSLFKQMDLLIFTLGLTEGWVHLDSDTVFPTAPGTIAGQFDPKVYGFKNFTHGEIYRDFVQTRAIIKRFNPGARFLLTVSPVPLTATASDDHVLVATTYSKSVLRAVAGELCGQFDDVDYFPSYEIIASPFSRGFFYDPNLRSVSDAGVEAVMRVFFAEHGGAAEPTGATAPTQQVQHEGPADDGNDVVCEELLLDAFAR
jgi:hypothetical protein